MRVAVTGGSGIVGSSLIRHLLDAGHEVKALARSDVAAERVGNIGAAPIIGDLLDHDALDRLAGGVEWMFHVAGVNELCPSDPEQMWRANVLGTRSVIDASARQGVRRMIYTSSAVVIGEPKGSVGSETTRHRGSYLSHYERTKAEAEHLALARRHDLEVIAVNPSSVQGPGRATGTGRILLEACRGRLPYLVNTAFSVVDIDDCAKGHLLAAQHGIPGERYILSGATTNTREAMAMLHRITGRAARPRYLRPGALTAFGWVTGAIFGMLARRPPLCPEAVRVMLHGHRYDGSRATAKLGLTYTPLEQTITRVVDWFFEEGLLA